MDRVSSAYHLNVAGDVVAAAEVEHLLGLLDPADERPREGLARPYQGEGVEGHGARGHAHHDALAVHAEHAEVPVKHHENHKDHETCGALASTKMRCA
jgi:hypothetical protein